MSLRECQRVLLRVILDVSSPMILHGAAWRCLALHGAAWRCLALHGSICPRLTLDCRTGSALSRHCLCHVSVLSRPCRMWCRWPASGLSMA